MTGKDGFDVAWITVIVLGLSLVAMVISFGIDGVLDDNEQVIAVSTVGGLATVASAALGYQVGSRSAPRRASDPGGPNAPEGPVPAPVEPGHVRLRP